MTARLVVVLLALAGGCASGGQSKADGDGRVDAPPGAPGDGAPGDGAPGDGARLDGPPGPTDGPGGTGGAGLDPDLSLPGPGGQVCTDPGRIGAPACPAAEVCRFFTSTEGRCEAGPASGGGRGTACTATSQCDLLFECYQGQCTEFCTLGTLACGAVADCLAIGHATRGVCRP